MLAAALADVTVHTVDGDHRVCVTHPEVFVPALIDAVDSVLARGAAAAA